jgi:hypothetical protein
MSPAAGDPRRLSGIRIPDRFIPNLESLRRAVRLVHRDSLYIYAGRLVRHSCNDILVDMDVFTVSLADDTLVECNVDVFKEESQFFSRGLSEGGDFWWQLENGQPIVVGNVEPATFRVIRALIEDGNLAGASSLPLLSVGLSQACIVRVSCW